MPIAEQIPVNSYTANGSTNTFAYTFKIFTDADLKVTVDGVTKTLTTDYTVTGAGNAGGGNVVFNSNPANGTAIVIYRDLAYKRDTDFVENGDLRANTIDDDIDRIVMIVQQLKDDRNRAIKLTKGETADQFINETASQRANKVIGFDASGLLKLKSVADLSSKTIGDGLQLVGDDLRVAADVVRTALANDFTASQKLKGDALLLRFNDTGASGVEWGIRSDGGNLELCENTGTEASPTWVVRQTITSAGIQSGWTALTATTDFSTTPASTSTITMNTDQRANIPVGAACRYKNATTAWAASTVYSPGDIRRWGTDNNFRMKCTTGGTSASSEPSATGLYIGKLITDNTVTWEVIDRYSYGQVAALTNVLMTIRGIPLVTGGANLTALEYSTLGGQVWSEPIIIDGYYEDATDSTLFLTDIRGYLTWEKPKGYVVGFKASHRTADTGTECNINFMVNAAAVSTANSNQGPAMSASGDTQIATEVDISEANYDINNGERWDIMVTKTGTGDAIDLTLIPIIVFP